MTLFTDTQGNRVQIAVPNDQRPANHVRAISTLEHQSMTDKLMPLNAITTT